MDKGEKILKAIKLSKEITSPYKRDMESILYAFANKFLSGKDLEQLKEELAFFFFATNQGFIFNRTD